MMKNAHKSIGNNFVMEIPKVSRMWSDLQQANRLPRNSSSCEAEMRELMRQIDIMVDEKRRDWESQTTKLKSKLSVREEELDFSRKMLHDKHEEIGELKNQLDNDQKSHQTTSAHYEKQLHSLREEVLKMQRVYERLQRKYSKNGLKEKSKTTDQLQHAVTRAEKDLQEYKEKSVEWEQMVGRLQKELETIRLERDSMAEKCNKLQREVSCQSLSEATETHLKSEISQLQNQLDRAIDTIKNQDTQLSKLKCSLEVAVKEKENIQSSNENVNQRLTLTKNMDFKTENDRLRTEVNSLKDAARRAEEREKQEKRLTRKWQQSCTNKDDILLKQQKNELRLKEQVEDLQEKLDALKTIYSRLNDSFAINIEDMVESIGNKFLLEQEEKTEELSKRLDTRVEQMKTAMDNTINKYMTVTN